MLKNLLGDDDEDKEDEIDNITSLDDIFQKIKGLLKLVFTKSIEDLKILINEYSADGLLFSETFRFECVNDDAFERLTTILIKQDDDKEKQILRDIDTPPGSEVRGPLPKKHKEIERIKKKAISQSKMPFELKVEPNEFAIRLSKVTLPLYTLDNILEKKAEKIEDAVVVK